MSTTLPFADRLQARITKTGSALIAGFDPVLEQLPPFILSAASKERTEENAVFRAITNFYTIALDTLGELVPAIKPNAAFYEQYGIGGMRAFEHLCAAARERGVVVVADAKRGDIGSTAAAYSNAFLGRSSIFGSSHAPFEADALTINPFLGFDTIEPFLKDCIQYGKGIFVLVRTSNPGSAAIQLRTSTGTTLSELLADWIAEHASALQGGCGYSGLGAVIGATHAEEGAALRARMPDSFLLVPGMGAQGGSAQDAARTFATKNGIPGGSLINLSRGLFAGFSPMPADRQELEEVLRARFARYQGELVAALSAPMR